MNRHDVEWHIIWASRFRGGEPEEIREALTSGQPLAGESPSHGYGGVIRFPYAGAMLSVATTHILRMNRLTGEELAAAHNRFRDCA